MHSLYTRINTGILVFIALTGIVLVTMMATRAYGGPLDPPGAPAPTMKTLQQVEPRTPISQPASFPIQINASGSYYLTENITGVAGVDGIQINASDVTIDLNGFTLYGGGGGGGITNFFQTGLWQGLTIRNGAIKGWDVGVLTKAFSQSAYEDLNVSNNNSWALDRQLAATFAGSSPGTTPMTGCGPIRFRAPGVRSSRIRISAAMEARVSRSWPITSRCMTTSFTRTETPPASWWTTEQRFQRNH